MPLKLIAGGEQPDICIDREILLIGRDAGCDVVLDSKAVSRQHCVIAQLPGGPRVRDLASRHGIRVNGAPQTEANLGDGDVLAIGDCQFRVEMS